MRSTGSPAFRTSAGGDSFAFAVTLEGTPIGCVGFDRRADGLEIGYWLDRRYWGRGLMSEAVSAALIWSFAAQPGGFVRSGVLSDNPASLRLQQKLGFTVVGMSEAYPLARSRSQPRIETRLDAAAFRPVPGGVPAAYRHVV